MPISERDLKTLERAERRCRIDSSTAFEYVFENMCEYTRKAINTGRLRLAPNIEESMRTGIAHAEMSGFVSGYIEMVDKSETNLNEPIVNNDIFEHAVHLACQENGIEALDPELSWAARRYFLLVREMNANAVENMFYFAMQGYIAGALKGREDYNNGRCLEMAHAEPWWQLCHERHRRITELIVDEMLDIAKRKDSHCVLAALERQNLQNVDRLEKEIRQSAIRNIMLCVEVTLEKLTNYQAYDAETDDADVITNIASSYFSTVDHMMCRLPLEISNIPNELVEAIRLSKNAVAKMLSRIGIIASNEALTFSIVKASEIVKDGNMITWKLDANAAMGACIAVETINPAVVQFIPDNVLEDVIDDVTSA